jgi:type IV secretion system protein TrbL
VPGSGANAGLGGAPQRDIGEQLGKLVDAMNAPKKPTHGENLKKHLGSVSQHAANEKAATHVSVNTHPHD